MALKNAEKEITVLEQAYKKRPESLLFARLADAYRKEGDIARAIELCINGLNLYPFYTTGRILLGRCYLEQQRYAEAIEAFTMVCSNDRRNQVALKMLADVFVQQGEEQKAADLYYILRIQEPANPLLRQLCDEHPSTSGNTDVYAILGLKSAHGSEISGQAGVIEGESGEAYMEAPAAEVPVADHAQQPMPSQEIPAEAQAYQESIAEDVSGDDIADRMSMLFSDGAQSAVAESAAAAEVSGTEGDTDVSGKDVLDRIDELFSDEPVISSGGTEAGLESAVEDIPDGFDEILSTTSSSDNTATIQQPDALQGEAAPSDEVSGADVSDRLDQMFPSESTRPSINQSDTTLSDIPQIEQAAGNVPDLEQTGNEYIEGGVPATDQEQTSIFGQKSEESFEQLQESGFANDGDNLNIPIDELPEVETTEPFAEYETEDSATVTGDDIFNRIDTLDEQKIESAPAFDNYIIETTPGFDNEEEVSPTADQVSGDDIADQFDEMFQNDTVTDEPAFSESVDFQVDSALEASDEITLEPTSAEKAESEVSGDDVADRFDMMFDEGSAAATTPTAESVEFPEDSMQMENQEITLEPTSAEKPEGEVSGDDVADRFDMMFDEGSAAATTPSAESLEFSKDSMQVENQEITLEPTSAEKADGEVSGDDVADRFDMLFDEESAAATTPTAESVEFPEDSIRAESPEITLEPTSAEKADGEVSGDDVADRFDMLFDEESAAATTPTAESVEFSKDSMQVENQEITLEPTSAEKADGEVSGDDVADRFDMLFDEGSDTVTFPTSESLEFSEDSMEPESPVTLEPTSAEKADGEVSGDDVADRFDMMVDEGSVAATSPTAESVDFPMDSAQITSDEITLEQTSAEGSGDEVSGDDVVERFGMMFDEMPALSGEIGEDQNIDIGMKSTSSPSDTLQIDRNELLDNKDQDVPEDQEQMPDLVQTIADDSSEGGQDGVSGSDVVDQLDIMFGDERSMESTDEITATEDVLSMEPVDNVTAGDGVSDFDKNRDVLATDESTFDPSKAEASVEEKNMPAEQSDDSNSDVLSGTSMIQTVNELFPENGDEELIGSADTADPLFEESETPEFEETMQFDSQLFEQMLNPTAQDAPFMRDEGEAGKEKQSAVEHIVPEVQPEEMITHTDASVSDERGDNFELLSASHHDLEDTRFRTEPPQSEMIDFDDMQTRVTPVLETGGEEVKELELLSEASEPVAQYEQPTEEFINETQQPEDRSEELMLESTATFEVAPDGGLIPQENGEELVMEPDENTSSEELFAVSSRDAAKNEDTEKPIAADASPSGEEVADHLSYLLNEEAIEKTAVEGISPEGEEVSESHESATLETFVFEEEPIEKTTIEELEAQETSSEEGASESIPELDNPVSFETFTASGEEEDEAFIETMAISKEDIDQVEEEPEINIELDVDQEEEITPVHPDGFDLVDGPPGISGKDVEKRLDNFFPASDLMSLSSKEALPPDEEQTEDVDEVSEFYTIAGEDAIAAKMEEVPEQLDEVEFVDEDVTHSEMVEAPEADMGQSIGEILPDVELFEECKPEKETVLIPPEVDTTVTPVQEAAPPDERDKPFDIPEHVLTPTLADIYYQQGQLSLAQQIYSRLLEREPDNEKLKKRMEEIAVALNNQETGAPAAEKANITGTPKKSSIKTVVKKSTTRKSSSKKKADDQRPLAGVHLRKRSKNAKKKPRKKK